MRDAFTRTNILFCHRFVCPNVASAIFVVILSKRNSPLQNRLFHLICYCLSNAQSVLGTSTCLVMNRLFCYSCIVHNLSCFTILSFLFLFRIAFFHILSIDAKCLTRQNISICCHSISLSTTFITNADQWPSLFEWLSLNIRRFGIDRRSFCILTRFGIGLGQFRCKFSSVNNWIGHSIFVALLDFFSLVSLALLLLIVFHSRRVYLRVCERV